ncbi:hypothetical protein, partial [Microtetraspora fusca]|uniref:hypothetical protein n=1 Tax=Microtetraspora fusca TaxID=1997 RepID=UPI001C3F4A20
MNDILAEGRRSEWERGCEEMMLSGGVLLSHRPEDAPPPRSSAAPSTSSRWRRGSRRHTPFIGSDRFSGDSYGAVLLDRARSAGDGEGAPDPAPNDTTRSAGRGRRRGEPDETLSWARRLLGLPDAAEDHKPDGGGRLSGPLRSPIAPAPVAPTREKTAEPGEDVGRGAEPQRLGIDDGALFGREELRRPANNRGDLLAWDGIWQGRRP